MENISATSRRRSIVTFSAIGVVACVVADMVHEVLGHVTVAWVAGVQINVISDVGIQTAESSRLVASAGTTAEMVVGALALLLFNRTRRWTNWTSFLWLFSAFSLLNSGYLMFSAVSRSGDWAVVISGLKPAWAWRCYLGFVGAALYVASLYWLTRSMTRMTERNDLALANVQRFIITGYLAGGVILTLASVFNPFSPTLILISGLGASFGLSAGLLFIPGLVKKWTAKSSEIPFQPAPLSIAWVSAAIIVGAIYVAVFGLGIRFHP